MAQHIKSDEFIKIAIECSYDPNKIRKYILDNINPSYSVWPSQISQKIADYRRKGLLPLESGNKVSVGEILKGTTTVYDEVGNITKQYVKAEVPKSTFLQQFNDAITELSSTLPSLPTVVAPAAQLPSNLATLYISNDIHFGALMWDKESGEDWNLDLALSTVKSSYDYLFETSPDSETAIVVDLGDLMEADNDKNMTPKSGNILATDSRYPKVLRAAYESLIYAINKALQKHQTVHFYNIYGK